MGLPGSGKSTIGRRLAKALDVEMLDTDAAIEQQTGRAIADIFATDGEKEFRRIEEGVIRTALADHDGVLSLGGGAVTTPGVREALAGHTVVYLEITAAEGIRRTGGNTVRPLLAGPDRPDAAFCVTDLIACGFMDAARHEFGLSVPDELSVIGFDDIEQASWLSYRLTSFSPPVEELAAAVVDHHCREVSDLSLPVDGNAVDVVDQRIGEGGWRQYGDSQRNHGAREKGHTRHTL